MRPRPRQSPSTIPDEPKVESRRWWRIPLSWLREESFYRDITTRAVSAGIVALVAYLYALGAGYISTPSGWQVVKGAFTTVVPFAASLLSAWIGWRFRGVAARNKRIERRLDTAMKVFLAFLAIAVVLVAIDYFVGLSFWPFNDNRNFPTR